MRTGGERLLEPSVGDGALLFAALELAKKAQGDLQIVACDVDGTAIEGLKTRVADNVELIQGNFLELDPEGVEPFDAVFANPPFTRNHQIPAEEKASFRARFQAKGPAGLWVYFVLHALKFLRPGGRMAFIVPAAAVFAEYSAHLLDRLRHEFGTVALHELPSVPKWVGGADERGALLLCDGYRASSARQVEQGLWSYELDAPVKRIWTPPASYDALSGMSSTLGQLARIRIGSVTGANSVFLMNSNEIARYSISPEAVVPILSRARQVVGLLLDDEDISKLAEGGHKTLLLKPTDLGARGGGVRRRLALLSPNLRRNTAWFSKRSPWWSVDAVSCDAVFTYMNDFGPKLALVSEGITCTNTLHALTFNPDIDERAKSAAVLTILSTYGQLAAEVIGRRYGGGVLKFELKETARLPVLPSSRNLKSALLEADEAIRSEDYAKARSIADTALLPPLLGKGWSRKVQEMRGHLTELRRFRRETGIIK